MRCCFHIASDSEPWRHASDSCHSRGCASEKTKRTNHDWCFHICIVYKNQVSKATKITILCLYSSDASWTAVSHALEPLAQTLLTSSIQYLPSKGKTFVQHRCEETCFIISLQQHVQYIVFIYLLCWSSKSHVVFLQQKRKTFQAQKQTVHYDVINSHMCTDTLLVLWKPENAIQMVQMVELRKCASYPVCLYFICVQHLNESRLKLGSFMIQHHYLDNLVLFFHHNEAALKTHYKGVPYVCISISRFSHVLIIYCFLKT